MVGTNASTGKQLSGLDHLSQSIRDILSTPLGSRVMLRDYGSRLFSLTDAPLNQGTIVDIYAATIEALNKWEPRITISSVKVISIVAGQIMLTLSGIYTPSGQAITLEGITA